MRKASTGVLTIAGFDPSGGAGILADVKTFENFKVCSSAVCTAITIQNETEFKTVNWVDSATIIEQIDILFKTQQFEYVKIGLIENLDVLEAVINHLIALNSEIKIIWDPIIKASAEFSFHKQFERKQLEKILRNLFLVAPNIPELNFLAKTNSEAEAIAYLRLFTLILVKGGHRTDDIAMDILYDKTTETVFKVARILNVGKHGSGCVLSSAITANLVKGMSLTKACAASKKYITGFLKSSDSLIGKHYKVYA